MKDGLACDGGTLWRTTLSLLLLTDLPVPHASISANIRGGVGYHVHIPRGLSRAAPLSIDIFTTCEIKRSYL